MKIKILLFLLTFIKEGFSLDIKAICELVQARNSGVTGSVTFTQDVKGGPVSVKGEVENLLHTHGFHIHESPLKGNNCTSADGHYNPFENNHGAKDSDPADRHVGDLGNIERNGQTTRFGYSDELLSLSGEYSIIGKSCVIHENKDDLGLGEGASLVNGNAGARIACGTIRNSSLFLHMTILLSFIIVFLLI